MKILINNQTSGIGHQIIDAWHAMLQSRTANYAHTNKYTFGTIDLKQDHDLTILCDYMPTMIDPAITAAYDLVLFCNGGEPIEVANPDMREMLTRPNVYLICNALLSHDHELADRVVWFPDSVQTCRDYWTRHFYPQYFENQKFQALPRQTPMSCITGSNRINRKYFFDNLQQAIPSLLLHAKVNQTVTELRDCQWESQHDRDFRDWLNNNHAITRNMDNDDNYYSQSAMIGIQNKFGSIPPGWFVLPMYFTSYCVIYPETSWINNELCVTEKALKCFYGGSLPMPVAGANVNKLYNQIGFATAWNLLPAELQQYDSELDHRQRFAKQIQAIAWLHDNPQVFQSQLFDQLTLQNRINFLTCDCDALAIERFDRLIQTCVA